MPETNGNNREAQEPSFEERWRIPTRFKAGFNTEDERRVLSEADARQKEWRESVGAAFASPNSAIRFRVKALETIRTLEPVFKAAKIRLATETMPDAVPIPSQPNPDTNTPLETPEPEPPIVFDDGMRGRLAEAYAMVGRYDIAADISIDEQRQSLYEKYFNAVTRPDDEWCGHGSAHQYIKEWIFSITQNKETELLACNVCGEWNAAKAPIELKQRESREASVRQGSSQMGIAESRAWMERNVSQKKS